MKVYNEEKSEIIENYDLNKGYLIDDKIFIKHYEEQKEIKEVSHEEIIAEYHNGGKDVEIIIDTQYKPFVEAYDEFEDIKIYIPFNEQELAQTELQELENWFNYYDLQAIQYSRAIRLGLSFDKDINVLDSQAIEKACRIKELRGLI